MLVQRLSSPTDGGWRSQPQAVGCSEGLGGAMRKGPKNILGTLCHW